MSTHQFVGENLYLQTDVSLDKSLDLQTDVGLDKIVNVNDQEMSLKNDVLRPSELWNMRI